MNVAETRKELCNLDSQLGQDRCLYSISSHYMLASLEWLEASAMWFWMEKSTKHLTVLSIATLFYSKRILKLGLDNPIGFIQNRSLRFAVSDCDMAITNQDFNDFLDWKMKTKNLKEKISQLESRELDDVIIKCAVANPFKDAQDLSLKELGDVEVKNIKNFKKENVDLVYQIKYYQKFLLLICIVGIVYAVGIFGAFYVFFQDVPRVSRCGPVKAK
ncbi:hypothetical protein POM88_054319 [Heracleum sosnowskyi]|uniref:Uncharacterized protein n=1 Tax=Heracleum sosnowskyi TaxID=360622 RepID=A0AAD8LWT0_9APIA|nr:hypothetical protein POM88_054319 [Heracleum sosnowskyi]